MSKRSEYLKNVKVDIDGEDFSTNFNKIINREIKIRSKSKREKPRQPNPKTLGRRIQSGDYFYTGKGFK